MHRISTALWADKRRKATTIILTAALGISSFALANWLSTSTGTGGGTFASVTAPTVTAAQGASTCGGSVGNACDMYIAVTNPNNVPLTVQSFASATGSPTDSNTTACPVVNIPTVNGGTVATHPSVAANATAFAVDLPNGWGVNATIDTGCQGVTFSAPVSVVFSN